MVNRISADQLIEIADESGLRSLAVSATLSSSGHPLVPYRWRRAFELYSLDHPSVARHGIETLFPSQAGAEMATTPIRMKDLTTLEQRTPEADVLVVTAAWPHPGNPARASSSSGNRKHCARWGCEPTCSRFVAMRRARISRSRRSASARADRTAGTGSSMPTEVSRRWPRASCGVAPRVVTYLGSDLLGAAGTRSGVDQPGAAVGSWYAQVRGCRDGRSPGRRDGGGAPRGCPSTELNRARGCRRECLSADAPGRSSGCARLADR